MSRFFSPLWYYPAVAAIALVAFPGCGGGGMQQAPKSAAEQPAGGADGAKKQPGALDPAAVGANAQPQMIIYTATLDVVIKDLDAALPEVEKLVAAHKGFVAKSEVRGDTGSPRVATFTLRVPVAGFPPLKEGLLALGSAERNAVETQDVTEEFIDVEARIKNLQEQERKLNELLAEKRKEEKLEDVIKVSDRIHLVRGDIERAQGRRNYLLNRVQLSTINLTLREIKDYKPPTAPTFGSRVSDTFQGSWEALVSFGQWIALAAVALAPWAPLWLPLLLLTVWGLRRLVRLARQPSPRPEPPTHHRPRRHDAPPGAAEPVAPPEEPRPPA